MKAIRSQLQYPIGLQLPVYLKMGIKNSRQSISMRLQKEQKIDNKKSIEFCQKALSKP